HLDDHAEDTRQDADVVDLNVAGDRAEPPEQGGRHWHAVEDAALDLRAETDHLLDRAGRDQLGRYPLAHQPRDRRHQLLPFLRPDGNPRSVLPGQLSRSTAFAVPAARLWRFSVDRPELRCDTLNASSTQAACPGSR